MKNKSGKIQRILLDHWERYQKEHPDIRSVIIENVKKVLACRTPLYGAHVYVCLECGNVVEVPHSCKSRFCSVCGYIATDNWIQERFKFILNCWYYHVVVTVPSFFRWMIKQNRKETLKLMLRCARETIREWCLQRGYEPATISFFHSFGEKLQFHPHFHLLVTAGGLTPKGDWYFTDGKLPAHVLMPIFKAKFIAGMKELFRNGILKTKAPLSRVFYQMNKQHDSHWQFYVKRITKKSTETMKYCVRYAKKMIISELRILDYDGMQVIIKTKKGHLAYPVEQFILLITQHIPERYFQLIGYDGFYANKSKKKYALAKRYWQPLLRDGNKLNWQDRQHKRDGKDPLLCKRCNLPLALQKVIYPKSWKRITMEDIYLAHGLAVQTKMRLNSS